MSRNRLKILIVEDDELTSLCFSKQLAQYGYVQIANSLKEVSELKDKFNIAFIDLDLDAPLAGLKILEENLIAADYKIITTSHDNEEIIEKAYSNGCDDFINKPIKKDDIASVIDRYKESFLKHNDEQVQNILNDFTHSGESFLNDITLCKKAIKSNRPILITGESGSGKSYLANKLHEQFVGSDKPFISLNCSTLSEQLIESQLFGHKKGAFTGATSDLVGKLELANGGTLFLDEIATLPIISQQKLLKVIEEKTFYSLGCNKIKSSNFKLITATCEDIPSKVIVKEFRSDFYNRINGHQFELQPLRNRVDDIPQIIKNYLKRNKRKIFFTSETINTLQDYSWPGNTRELLNILGICSESDKGKIEPNLIQNLLKNDIQYNPMVDLKGIEYIKNHGLNKYIQMMEDSIFEQFTGIFNGSTKELIRTLQISNNKYYGLKKRSSV